MLIKRGFLAREPYAVQLVILVSVIAFMTVVFGVLAVGLASQLYGLDITNFEEAIRDYDNPAVIAALQMMQVINSLGLFLIGPLAFVLMVTRKPLNYLKINARLNLAWVPLTVVVMILALPAINYSGELNKLIDIGDSLQQTEDNLNELTEALLSMGSVGDLLFTLFMIALLPAVGEELLFRGVLQPLLARWTRNVHLGIWIAAFLFAALHMQFATFLPRFLLGALFGYMVVWTGSLILPMVAHFTNNALAVVVNWYIQQGQIPDNTGDIGAAEGELVAVLISIVVTAGGLFLMWRQRVPYDLSAFDRPAPPPPPSDPDLDLEADLNS